MSDLPPQMYPPPPPGFEIPGSEPPGQEHTNQAPANWYPPAGNYYGSPSNYYPAYTGYPLAGPEQRRRMTGCAIAVAIAGLGFLGLCVAGFIVGVNMVMGWRDDGLNTTEAFFKAAAAGDIEQMYAQFSQEAQITHTRSSLRSFVSQRQDYLPKYKSFRSTDFNVNTSEGTYITMTLGGTVTYADNRVGSFRAELIQINDKWLISTIQVDSPETIRPVTSGQPNRLLRTF